MGFYSRVIFPRLCDFALDRPQVAEHRQRLLSAARGRVLEIGFSTGLNLPHYPPQVRRITAVDPNVGMNARARRRIEQTGITVNQHLLSGEQLPLADRAFDCVVSTFTLCSVSDVAQVLTEIRRVLARGGQFLFLEHGLAPEPKVQKWQRRFNRLQMLLGDGCHLDRDILQLIASQPFSSLQVQQFYLPNTPKTHGFLSTGAAWK